MKRCLMAVLLVAVGIGTPASAHPYYDQAPSVDIDNDTAVLGVPSSDVAHVFVREGSTWLGQATLFHPEGSESGFGHSVAVHGDTMLVGAPGEDSLVGAVYVYVRQGKEWHQQATLRAEPERDLLFFGWSVDLYENTAIVGARNANFGGAGAATVFTRTGLEWTQEADLLSQIPSPPWFGWAVSLEANTAAVGAPFDDRGSDSAGAVYVFARTGTTWQLDETLHEPMAADGRRFGFAVDLDGDALLVGAHPEFTDGSAHLFRRLGDAWGLEASFTDANGTRIGFSVALDGDRAIVGDPDDLERFPGSGVILVFERIDGTWVAKGKRSHPEGWDHSAFGYAIAMDEGHAIVVGGLAFLDASAFDDLPPEPTDDAYSVAEDQVLSIGRPGVLGNDLDPEGAPLTSWPVTDPTNGSLRMGSDGDLLYQPTPDFHGSDTFVYRLCAAWRCETATVSLEVTPVNDPPVADDQHVRTNEDSSVAVRLTATDLEGIVEYHLGAGPTHGTLTGIAPDLIYHPAPDFNGTDSFTFRAFDGELWSNEARVTINVRRVNDPPEAHDDAASTAQYEPVVIDVLANDVDVDGDALRIISVSQPEHGEATISDDGITYDPDTSFKQSDSFSYSIADWSGIVATATVTVTEIGCGEDGAQALDGTPAEGAASETIDREVEPLAGRHDRASAEAIHKANCTYVVAIEDQLDDP